MMNEDTHLETDTEEANSEQVGDEQAVQQVVPEDALPEGADENGLLDVINNGGVKQMLLQESYRDPETGHEYGQAHLVADIINVMRMDTKQMCRLHDIDIEVNKMSPERAAELLESVATNDGIGIIEVFQLIEDDMDRVFKEEMTEEQHEQYMTFKEQMLYSVDSGASR